MNEEEYKINIPNFTPLNEGLSDIMTKAHNFKSPEMTLIEKQEEANNLLGQIAENTSVLKELVLISRETKLNTEELTYVMRAIYSVAKANNKTEADNFFKKAIDAINGSGEASGNITNLVSLLLGIYNTVITML